MRVGGSRDNNAGGCVRERASALEEVEEAAARVPRRKGGLGEECARGAGRGAEEGAGRGREGRVAREGEEASSSQDWVAAGLTGSDSPDTNSQATLKE